MLVLRAGLLPHSDSCGFVPPKCLFMGYDRGLVYWEQSSQSTGMCLGGQGAQALCQPCTEILYKALRPIKTQRVV